MSKRYYISDIIGDGLEPETAFRPAIQDLGVDFVTDIPVDENGKPIHNKALCIVSAVNHARVIADKRNSALPDFALDVKVAAMNLGTKVAMKNMLKARKIPAAVADNADGFREVIRGIGNTICSPGFSEDNFDIPE